MFNFFKNIFSKKKIDYKSLIGRGAIILDVRSPGEFNARHIKGSRNIPVERLTGKMAEIKSLRRPIITVCKSGARSAMAKSILAAAGIEVHNGGAWYTLEKKL